MAIGRVSGSMLVSNLDRQGTDLQITSGGYAVLYVNVNQRRIGVNTATVTETLTINGNLSTSGVLINGYTVGAKAGQFLQVVGGINLGSVGDVKISGGNSNWVLSTDGNGNLSWANIASTPGGVITSGNVESANVVTTTVYSNTIVSTGNIITDGNIIGNTNIISYGNIITNNNFISYGGNIVTVGGNIVTVGGNVITQGGNIVTNQGNVITNVVYSNNLTVTQTITSGNITATGNVNATNVNASQNVYAAHFVGDGSLITGLPATYANVDANAYFNRGIGTINVQTVTATDINAGTLNSDYLSGASGSLRITPAGNLTIFNNPGAIVLPGGSDAQRPVDATYGSFRWNTSRYAPEYFNGTEWVSFETVSLSTQSIIPDGVTSVFTLNKEATSSGVLVSLNGTVQQPDVAYTVYGDQLTFAEVPQPTDVVDIRYMVAGIVMEQNNTTVTTANTQVNTSQITVDSFDKSAYRSAKYTVTATSANGEAQITDCYIIHNGTNVNFETGSSVYVGSGVGYVITLSARIIGNNIELRAISASTGTQIKIQKVYFTV